MRRALLSSRSLAVIALAAALVAALVAGLARRASPAYADFEGRPYAALDPDADYRRRLVTLALAGSTSLLGDAFVDPHDRGARDCGARAAAATVAALHACDPSGPPETGGVEARRAEALLARALASASALAALLAAALAASCVGGSAQRRMSAAVLAAVPLALSPLAIGREQAAALSLHSAQLLLAVLQYAALAFAVRRHQRVDVTVGALAAGACAGTALALGSQGWPTTAACVAIWSALSVRAHSRSEFGRAPIVVAFAFVLSFAACRGELALADLAPSFDGFARGWSAMPASRSSATAAAALCVAWLLFEKRSEPLHAALLLGLFLSAALASVDARFSASAHAAWAVGAGVVGARAWSALSGAGRRAAWLGVLCAEFAVSAWPGASAVELESRRAERESVHAALKDLRDREPAPGSFNHPRAAVDWRVASAPALAGPIAHRARRPTLAFEFEARPSTSAKELSALFALGDAAEFTARADSSAARYVLVCAAMWNDPACAHAARDGTLLARLLQPSASVEGWSLVFDSGRWSAPGMDAQLALAALWRRD